MKKLLTIFILLLVYSCSNYSSSLEYALDFAGENRDELVNVLEHYEREPEKKRAAEFLIENMPTLYSYSSSELDTAFNMLEGKSISVVKDIYVKNKSRWMRVLQNSDVVYDSHVITSKYLINHIDRAFELKDLAWNKELTFEDFCEYLLPYRVGNEKLEQWILDYNILLKNTIDSVDSDDMLENAKAVLSKISNTKFTFTSGLPYFSPSFLYNNKFGSCREYTALAVYALRSVGIPCAIDMFIYSPTFKGGHQWNVIIAAKGTIYPFELDKGAKIELADRKRGKVYRKTFSCRMQDKELITYNDVNFGFKSKESKYVDVTDEYYDRNKIELKLDGLNNKNIYINVFSKNGYIPIDISTVRKNRVVFNNIEPNILCQLTTFDKDKEIKMLGYPFLTMGDTIKEFIPDTTLLEDVVLRRKYPLRKDFDKNIELLYNSIFLGANLLNMDEETELCCLGDQIDFLYNNYSLNTSKKYRYYKLKYSEKSQPGIGELEFWSRGKKMPYIVVPKEISLIDTTCIDHYLLGSQKINDNNSLTYYACKYKEDYSLYDLGASICVDSIVMTVQNDDNFIVKGDEYELLYNNGNQGWVLIDKYTATCDSIVTKVPANSLLWLKNNSKGVEEQLFYTEKGKQTFPEKFL